MPSRDDVFQNGDYYHIYDKTIDHKNIFTETNIATEFISTFFYYRSTKIQLKYSKYKKLAKNEQNKIVKSILLPFYFNVNIIAYCLMPNHYHFLIRQRTSNGIVTFMSTILNSITRYYNKLKDRKGPIFLTQFRSKKIYTEEQLVYVARYIHTNPYASGTVDTKKEIFTYPYSSINAYLGPNPMLIDTALIMNYFSHSVRRFCNFIEKNAQNQKLHKYLEHIDKWA